jgi:hypothetical protein
MAVAAAFSGLNPEEGDVVKSEGGSISYSGGYWRGDFTTLNPGKGYIYYSNATVDKTLNYGTNISK